MAFWNPEPRTIRRLTDVQLVHKLNDAISERERTVALSPVGNAQRLLRLIPAWSPELAYVVVALVQFRDALHGLALAVSVASAERLTAWNASREAHLRAIDEDVRILALIGELDRRARCASAATAAVLRRT